MGSRDITAAAAAELARRRVAPVYLVDLEFDSGTTRVWSGVGDLVWNGNTYQGAGELLGLGAPSETTDVRAEGAQVSLSGIPAAWISTALQEPYQGRTARMHLGFMQDFSANYLFQQDGEIILIESGEDLLVGRARTTRNAELINDPITLFTGRMDQMQIDEQGDTSTIALSLESNLIDLNKPRERRYTDQDQKADYPNDRGFEYVAGLQGKALTWGPDTRSKNERVRDIARIRADVTAETRRFVRDGRRIQQQVAVDDEGNVVAEGQEVSLGLVGGAPGGGQGGSPGLGGPGIGGSPGGHGRV